MSKLESITVGSFVKGLINNEVVEIVATTSRGDSVLEVVFKDSRGKLDSQLLFRDSERFIEIIEKEIRWKFNCDANLMKLLLEAYRINLSHIFDPYLAVHTSEIEPLPHQILAVYQEMLPRLPLRYILADDPGAGKTVMTGLFIKELILRGDLKRCLIVSPGSLVEQWQDELFRKFGLRFEILSKDRIESAVSRNIFTEINYCIARLDKLARNDKLQEKLKSTDWDLIVVDEAHKMSATVWGGEVKYTKRFNLGRLLSEITRHFLLLTATPHNGKNEDFQLFMSLIDYDRFVGATHTNSVYLDVSDVMRRLVKEELLKFDGTPLFPERRAYTVNYDLSKIEAELYDEVTNYVREEFNRADTLNNVRKNTVGFALTILQRRLASSPEAIYQSLCRRIERLEKRLAEEKLGGECNTNEYDIESDYDDIPSAEIEILDDKIVDRASASTTIHEFEEEIRMLRQLADKAQKVRVSGEDRKWNELSSLLQDSEHMFDTEGKREKLIIFTEHRDTLNYLAVKVRSLLGNNDSVVTIHGSMSRDDRHKAEELFMNDKDVRILIATDAAGEGINLQRAHLVVNYDLPWNPNRLEQRFGRVHRIGQTEVCHLWNLVSKDTREGKVFQRLFNKLEKERKALGGKVFDILGKITFDNAPLRELLIKAIRYGNDPVVRNKLYEAVDNSLEREHLERLLKEHALIEDTIDISRVLRVREDIDRMETHKLQPHFIEAFFVEVFQRLGGKIRLREKGKYEITYVPNSIVDCNIQIGLGEPVLSKYERVCFDKNFSKSAVMIAPGHPLLEAVIDLIIKRNSDILKRGCVFIDDEDIGTEARLLFTIEDSIQDGTILPNGEKNIISRDIHFVEISDNGFASNVGYAPYLDYRASNLEEQNAVLQYVKEKNLFSGDIENYAVNYAVEKIIPKHLEEVKKHKLASLDKISKAVKERLTSEIQYWDCRAAELKQKEASGKSNQSVNVQNAARRAEDLEARMDKRLSEINQAKMISALPPVVISGALVIPRGLLCKILEKTEDNLFAKNDRRKIELVAMKAVMDAEFEQGYIPCDVSLEKRGYDIESVKEDNCSKNLRFIEVKGRIKGASTVTVSTNEIRTGLNKPENFILALVEVDGNVPVRMTYLKKPFRNVPDFTVTSVNFNIAELIRQSEIIYEK